MLEPPVRFPRITFILSTIEILLGYIFIFVLHVGAVLAYFAPTYRQVLTEYWTSIKTAETCLEVMNYILLVKGGLHGRSAVHPPVGQEINSHYSDFLTYNIMGAILSVMQMIMTTVEIMFLDVNVRPIIRWLTIYPVAIITLTLLLQCTAMSLDVVPWRNFLTPLQFYRRYIIGPWQRLRLRRDIHMGRYRNIYVEESDSVFYPLTAQTSVCSAGSSRRSTGRASS